MKVLVTGGTGFIASHLVDALIKRKHSVTAVDKGGLSYRNPSVKYVFDDLSNPEAAGRVIKDCDIVFHLASNYSVVKSTEDPRFDFENNVTLTFNVLEAMRRNDVKKIVLASTSAVYGVQKKFPIKEDVPAQIRPISNYAAGKLASETYIHSFSHLYGMEGLILRIANIVGPRSNHGLVPDIVRKVQKTPKKIEVLGSGMQKKSYMHVSDCVAAMTTAAEKYRRFDIFNVGYEEWMTVKEIVEIVCDEMKASPKIAYTGGEAGWSGDV